MSVDVRQVAVDLLTDFKGSNYRFGADAIAAVAEYAAEFGNSVLLIAIDSEWLKPTVDDIRARLAKRGIGVLGGTAFPGALPNAPREDVYRLAELIKTHKPDSIVVVGGGSTIDAAKAANVLASLGNPTVEILIPTLEQAS